MYFLDKIGILSDLIRKSNLDTDNKVARKQFEDAFTKQDITKATGKEL